MIGSTLASRYEIVSELGRGGMGVVYRAHDPILGRDVAVKLVPPSLLNEQSEERFQREARVVAQMDHPSIVPIYDFGRHEGSVFFLMPVVTGQNLRAFLRNGSRNLGEILDIVIQAAEALEYSHARGVVHRDIKPENIMVTEEEGDVRVRVMDFGLATASSEDRITRTGTLIGTVCYFSPEQVMSAKIDHRADIYALGTVLYECVAGEPPFTGEMQTILYRIVHEFPQPLRSIGAEIDDELEQIVARALAKDPAKRFQNAGEMTAALRHYRSRLRESDRARSIVLSTAMTAQVQRPAGAPFVGREKELAELQRRLNLAVEGEAQFVVVAGEPGIGKTRLLEELENLARARRIRVLHGRFVEQDRTFSYQGFCEVIQDYFRSRDAGHVSSGEVADFSDLGSELAALFPVLSEIPDIRRSSGDVPVTPAAARSEDRTTVYELLARTLARIAGGKPLLLVLENLHGAEMSLDALQYVIRRLGPTPTMIAATYRQTEIDKAHPLVRILDGFSDDPRFVHIILSSLTPSEHRQLLESVIGSSKLSDELSERLFEATEANPFFTRELVRSLIDSGGISSAKGEWTLSGEFGALGSDALPATIQQAIEKRIERLPDELRELLATASILGKTFDFRDLELLSGGGRSLDDAVDALIAEGLIEEDRESRGDRLTFTSGIVRDVLYGGLSRRKRKSLHRACAEQLEQRHAGRLERIFPQLLHHYSEGDVPEKTVRYGFELARKSIASFSAEEAIQVIRTVLEFLEDEEWGPDPQLEGDARLIHAAALRLQGNLEGAMKEAEHAVRIFERAGAFEKAAEALLHSAETSWQTRRIEETRQALTRGIELARSTGRKEILLQMLSLAATVANLRGEYEKASNLIGEIERMTAPESEGDSGDIPRGGMLRVALVNAPKANEPSAVGLDEEVEALALVYEPLVATDERGHLIPALCEKWDVRNDGRSLLVTLRRGIRFHDGDPLTAETVRQSFERSILLRKREVTAAFTAIEGVEAFRARESDRLAGLVVHSERELEIRITEPLPIYAALLSDPTTGIVKVVGGADPTSSESGVVGTGPFRIASHEAGALRLERFEEYWRSETPPVDGVEFRTMSSAAAIAEGLQKGTIDIARDLLPQDLEHLLRDPRYRAGLVEAPKKNTYFAAFNCRSSSALPAALRRALTSVVRTHDVVWRTLGRLAHPAAGLIPPGILGHDPGRKRPFVSREQAADLMREAGIETPLTLSASVHPLFQDRYRSLMSAIFDLWSELGIEVTVATPTMEQFLDSFQNSDPYDLIVARWNADYDDPDNFTHGLFSTSNGVYSNFFSSAETDQLLAEARSNANPNAREGLYRRFETMVLESGAILPLFHEIDYRVGGPRVRGMQLRSSPPYVNYAEIGKAAEESDHASVVVGSGGGSIQIPMIEGIRSLEPTLAGTVERGEVVPTIFETLTRAEGARVVPWLCSEFRVEDGARRYRFFLRNVYFHNGRRLTARDVRYSWERLLLDRDNPSRGLLAPIRGAKALMEGEADDLEGFRILSAQEFVVELENPLSFFPAIISHPVASVLQEGTEVLRGTWRDGCVGTGPFRVIRFDPGSQLELERNPAYWREGFPRSERMQFRFGLSPAEIASEFRAGHLSIATDLFPLDVEQLRHEPEFAAGYREMPRLSIYCVAFNNDAGPLKDASLRREIVARLQPDDLVRRTIGRLAIPAHGVIPPGLLGYSADGVRHGSSERKVDRNEIIELRALVHPTFFGQYSNLGRQIDDELQKIGIRLEYERTSMEEYSEGVLAGEHDVLIGRWIADYPDADTFVYGLLHSEAGFAGRFCATPEIDRLAEQARVEVDPSARHAIYRKVEEIVASQALLAPLFYEQVYAFCRPEVGGLSLNFAVPTVSYDRLHVKG